MYLNKVQLIGNLTRDPELKALPSGVHVCSFSLATNETYMKEGKKIEKVEFHTVIAFAKTAENIAKFMTKGSQIMVEGKLQTRSWDKDGVKQYRTEIVAGIVQFGNKPKGQAETRNEKEDRGVDTDVPEYPEDEINPEDIPF